MNNSNSYLESIAHIDSSEQLSKDEEVVQVEADELNLVPPAMISSFSSSNSP